MAIVGMVLLSWAVTGVAALIFDVVSGHAAAVIAALVTFGGLCGLWGILPLAVRGRPTNIETPDKSAS